MAWWNRLFKKKEPIQQEEDWEQLVYTRNGVNFDEEDQRKRYIVNCLEQIAEASKEIDLLTGEYTLVTSYLTDTDEIEALPAEQREEVNRVAGKLAGLEQERSRYREKKNRMRDADFYAIRKRENEIEEGIQKIRDGEKYGNLIRQDLHRLDGERHAYEYRRNELENLMNNQRGMAVIFLTALIVCVIMLVILQYALEMDVYVGLFLAVGAGAVAISYVCIRYMDAGRELQRVEKTINKIIQLQNKVKIRYVNNCQLMEYLYLKYNTDSAAKLEKQWKMYQDEKEERKQFAEAEAKIEYYQKQLVQQLAGYRVRIEPRSRVYHLGGGSLAQGSPSKVFYNHRNNLAMLYKCASPVQRSVVAIVRPVLDSCAALSYLMQGRPDYVRAVGRAWRDFLRAHKALAAKRRAVRGAAKGKPRGIYCGSIVLRYLLGRRRFGKLL